MKKVDKKFGSFKKKYYLCNVKIINIVLIIKKEKIMATFKTTNVEELKAMLHEGIVEFEFIKKDGSVRNAKGTLLAEYLPASNGNTPARKKNDNVQVYYDLDKKSFRSFLKASFVGAY